MPDTVLFRPDCVMFGVSATSKKQLFQEMATRLISTEDLAGAGLACRDIVSAAMERERLGSTGVGNGVALPHARIAGPNEVSAVFARLDTPIDFDAVDDRPVDLVVLLLAPEDAGGAHLRALARVSRLLRRAEVRSRLRAAPSAEALYTIIAEHQTDAAA